MLTGKLAYQTSGGWVSVQMFKDLLALSGGSFIQLPTIRRQGVVFYHSTVDVNICLFMLPFRREGSLYPGQKTSKLMLAPVAKIGAHRDRERELPAFGRVIMATVEF